MHPPPTPPMLRSSSLLFYFSFCCLEPPEKARSIEVVDGPRRWGVKNNNENSNPRPRHIAMLWSGAFLRQGEVDDAPHHQGLVVR